MYPYHDGGEVIASGPRGITRRELYAADRQRGLTHEYAAYRACRARAGLLDSCRLCEGSDAECPMCGGHGQAFTKSSVLWERAKESQ